ncbi:MAG TPA: CoA transferase, partial [Acidimicrobiales bacterium]|nr:CoA transferase [Acidimicrobiales bacterium]
FATRTRDEWVAELAGADTCVAPVLEIDEVVADEHFRSRAAVVEAEHPTRGRFPQTGAVMAGMAALPDPVPLPDPERTDTADLLAAAGVPGERVAELLAAGVVA